jgi:GDP-L-fucose synthase
MRLKDILVTGGTGFLGRQVVRACREAGLRVRSCSRSEGVDLRDGDSFATYLCNVKPACIVHCAAHVGGIGYVGEHAVEVFQDNLKIASGLMHGMHLAGVRVLVTAMPNCTYPGAKDIYREPEWWDGEIHPSVLMYGLPRKTLWGLCKTYGDATGLQSAHLIFPNMYGPGDHFEPKRSHALGALIAKISAAKRDGLQTVEVWGTGKPVREWMYVQDASLAIVRFLEVIAEEESALKGHPIYNVGIGEGVSIGELAETIREVVGWEGSFAFDENRPDGAMQKLLDGNRFHKLTGWKPQTTLLEGIEKTVAWYRQNVKPEVIHARS